MDHCQLARTLFDAFERGDAEAARHLLAPGFTGTQNGGPAMDADTLLGFASAVSTVVRDFRYEDIACSATEGGFVEEHAVRGTLPDGSSLELTACVVGEIADGRITKLREYLDTRAAAGLLAALAPGA